LVASVTLTDAQIKTLPTLGFEVIAAQGSGKMIQIISANLSFNWTADYNIDGDEVMNLLHWNSGANSSNTLIESGSQVTALLAGGASKVATLSTYQLSGGTFNGVVDTRTNYNNDPVYLFITRGGGALTGGNAANTLKVTVYYVVVDL